MIRIKNGTNQRRGFEEFSSEHSDVNLWSARYRGAIAGLTYVCCTMEVHKQGTLEVHFTSLRCITHVHDTPAVKSASPDCPVAVKIPLCFDFLWNELIKKRTAAIEQQKIVKLLAVN
jgi:hypothetical protein